MASSNYSEQAQVLSEAIDIGIEAIKKFPPKGFDNSHINLFVKTYIEYKNKIINPDSRFKSIQSLSYIRQAVLAYFQEGTGEAIKYFWKQIADRHLPFKRVNKLTKILKSKKIKNEIEYDFVIDVLLSYQQDGLINASEVGELNKMISDFEKVK